MLERGVRGKIENRAKAREAASMFEDEALGGLGRKGLERFRKDGVMEWREDLWAR